MTKKVFKGSINGVEFADVTEFNKALTKMNKEDVKSVYSSYEVVETSDEETPVIESTQRVEDKTYDPYDVLGSIFGPIFNSFKQVQAPVEKKEEKPFDPSKFLVKLNLDKMTADEDKNDEMLDEYSELLYERKKEFDELTETQQEQIRELAKEKLQEIKDKQEATEESYKNLQEKMTVLEGSSDALDIQMEYYNDIMGL